LIPKDGVRILLTMAAIQTRLLVLAVVALFEPVNGNQVRRELAGWGADRWGQVQPGSVYSMLGTLAKQAFVTAHEVEDGARRVTVYTMTADGRSELARTFERIITTPDPANPVAFFAAASQAGLLTRERFLELLRARQAAERQLASAWASVAPQARPPVVEHSTSLWLGIADAERAWVARTIRLVEDGGLAFQGEPGAGQSPVDPELPRDRERYRKLIAAQGSQ
jgi:DNA-binding PadR family transcriptional regulator